MNSSNELGIPKVLQDQLSRVDGENAGLISGGLGRLMERYELIGILGEGGDYDPMGSGDDGTNTGLGQGGILHGGGAADFSFAKRFHSSNMTSMSNVISGMVSTSIKYYVCITFEKNGILPAISQGLCFHLIKLQCNSFHGRSKYLKY